MTEKNIEGNQLSPRGVIVLGVFIHCQGCAHTIRNSLRGFEGVEVVEIDSKNHKVTVKGAKADPIKVVERVRKKSCKHVELISPVLSTDKKEENIGDKKQEPKLVEITLKVNLHCPGCATDVKQTIHKIKGVVTVETYLKDSIVKVMGSMEAEKVVELVKKREGKQAVVVKQEKKGSGKKDDQNKNQNEGGGGGGGGGEHRKGGRKEKDSSSNYPNYPTHLVYAPQLFSDENPNACSTM